MVCQNAKFVLAIEDYETRESTLLSFKNGAVIKLKHKDGLDDGWLFGMYEGQTGSFPNEYVSPIMGAPTESAIEVQCPHALFCHITVTLSVGCDYSASQTKCTKEATVTVQFICRASESCQWYRPPWSELQDEESQRADYLWTGKNHTSSQSSWKSNYRKAASRQC